VLTLSKTSGYAISALSRLSGPGGGWSLAKDLASSTGVPRPYLSSILHTLARNGLIRAKRGYRGGFALAAPAEQISVFQVVEAIDGPAWRGSCLLGLTECSDERACPTHAFWKAERNRIERYLRSMSLAQVAAFENRNQEQLRRRALVHNQPAKRAGSRTRARKAKATHSRR